MMDWHDIARRAYGQWVDPPQTWENASPSVKAAWVMMAREVSKYIGPTGGLTSTVGMRLLALEAAMAFRKTENIASDQLLLTAEKFYLFLRGKDIG